jgi:hypothetical protein
VILLGHLKVVISYFYYLEASGKTKPNQTKPNQTKPNQTKPNQTKPNQTKPTMATVCNMRIGLMLCIFLHAPLIDSFISPTTFFGRSVMQSHRTKLSSTSQDEESSSLWKYLTDRFQGDFDNYNQVVEDRKQNMLPREGGGHEHIHCTLIPLTNTSRLAAFYFDGAPQRMFRFRYYELLPSTSDTRGTRMEMRLYTLNPELEGLFRAQSEDPVSWPAIFESFQADPPLSDKIRNLPNCEVSWSLEMDPDEHAYVLNITNKQGVHAVMVHGEAIVDSQMAPGSKIRILDQLSLFDDVFYINDRGFDPETGAYIYGNQREIPFRLDRVTTCKPQGRNVVDAELQWTLGPKWRDEGEYEENMAAIGGPSAAMNKK